MIGQEPLKLYILKVKDKLPAFMLLVGEKGSGRKTLSKYISKESGATLVYVDTKVAAVREMIAMSYKQTEPILYVIPNADKMSIAAKNSLLKVTEEPPRNAHFILTTTNLENMLGTLISRAEVIRMNPYSESQLNSYIKEGDEEEREILLRYCNNIGQIDKLLKYDICEFRYYIKLVIDNIGTVNGANAFKMANKLNVKKDDEEKYDIELFLRGFSQELIYYHPQYSSEDVLHCLEVTSRSLTQLDNPSLNRQMLIDRWILDIRRILI